MKYEILISLLSIVLLIIILFVIAALGSRMCQQKKTSCMGILQKALSIIISCNTYPKMLTVFTRLESNVEKYGIEVKDNFRGYFKDE